MVIRIHAFMRPKRDRVVMVYDPSIVEVVHNPEPDEERFAEIEAELREKFTEEDKEILKDVVHTCDIGIRTKDGATIHLCCDGAVEKIEDDLSKGRDTDIYMAKFMEGDIFYYLKDIEDEK